jgi:GH24 family phage-related lysozyme (muramidase)
MDPFKDYAIKHEGKRSKAYKDIYGNITIAIGRNLTGKGLSEDEIDYLWSNDYLECLKDLKTIFPNWASIEENKQLVLFDMRFQLGPSGFRKFKRLIGKVGLNDWQGVAQSIRNSLLYKQVPVREDENIKLLLEGDVT